MDDELTICLSITSVCNMHCYYCFSEYDCNGEKKHMSKKLLISTLGTLRNASKSQSIRLVILGGEPTLYPNIDNVCLEALSFCRKVILVTNGANKDIIEKIPKDISIDVSYHGQDVSAFTETVKAIQRTHFVQVLCPVDTLCIDKCLSIQNWCFNSGINFEPIPIVDNNTEKVIDYNNGTIDCFKSNILYNVPNLGVINSLDVYKETKNSKNEDTLRLCSQKNIAIYPDGKCYPCCKTGLLKYKTHIDGKKPFRYKILCEHQYCLRNRGCLDFAGWRQDPDGFLPWNN